MLPMPGYPAAAVASLILEKQIEVDSYEPVSQSSTNGW
jgi:hypothetical protein